ncbi:MAG: transcriptional regulator [Burkholderiaceae bacterium]
MDDTHAVKALAALAQASRLQVFRALVVAGPQGLTRARSPNCWVAAGDVVVPLEGTDAGRPGQSERSGRHLIYRAEFAQMNDLLGYLTAHCCQGEPCLEPAEVACKT